MNLRLNLAVLALCLSLPSFAQPSTETLTLQDCLARVEKGSVQVAQSVLEVARSKGSLKEIESQRLPVLVGQANLLRSYDLYSQSNDANKAVIRLEQNSFPFLGPIWPQAKQKSREVEAAEMMKVESEHDVRLLVKQLYFAILRDQESIERTKNVEAEFAKLVATSIPRYNFGSAPSFDLVKIRGAKYDFYRTRSLLESQLVFEQSQLSQIIALPHAQLDGLHGMTKLPALPDADQISAYSKSSNPTFLVNDKQIESAKLAVDAAQAARIPTVSAFSEIGSFGQTLNSMTAGWDVGVQLRLPIFDWGLISSQVHQAQAQLQLSERKKQADHARIESDLLQTHALAKAHLNDRNNLAGLLGEVRRTALNMRERYRRGGASIIELTDAINLWLQTEVNERAAFYGYLSDMAKLDRLSGEKLEIHYE